MPPLFPTESSPPKDIFVEQNAGLAAPDKGHGCGHDRHELDVRLQGQICHVQDGGSDMFDIHHGLGRHCAVGLGDAFGHRGGHVRKGVADINLTAGDVEWPTIQRQCARQAGDGVFGHRIGRRAGARDRGRDRAVVDNATAHRGLDAHMAKGGAGAKEHASDVNVGEVEPILDIDFVNQGRRECGAGIVEQRVDAAPSLGSGIESDIDLFRVGDIARQDKSGRVAIGGLRKWFSAAADQAHAPARGKKSLSSGAADARARAGDKNCLWRHICGFLGNCGRLRVAAWGDVAFW